MTLHDIVLSVDGIFKTFGDIKAVDGVSFEVARGEIFGLLGPNGAGKTTTIRMLMGITAPDQGSINYNFTSNGHVLKRIGYLPEERGMYQTTRVLESIIYFGELKGMKRNVAKKEALNWLERLQLEQYANKKTEELSKGMQQKVQFIVSIIHQPELVVLDEIFDGLDPVNQDFFKGIVRELAASGMTVLLSSHRMNLVEELCDRIFMINHGTKVLYGKLAEIKDGFGEEKVLVRYQGDPVFFKNHPHVHDLISRPEQVEFYLDRDITPNDFLRQIPAELKLKEISIIKPPLHDIFVRTVKEGE